MLIALASIALLTSAEAGASPLDKYKPRTTEGKRYYKLGANFLLLKNYELAIKAFKDGFLVEDAPVFLYNLAVVHGEMGKLKESIDYYERFLLLARDPHPAVKRGVEKLVKKLRAELKKRERDKARDKKNKRHSTAKPPPPVKLPPGGHPIPEPWYSDGVGWAITAAGFIAGGVGLGLLSNASALRSDAKRELNVDTRRALEARADTRETIGIVFALTGVATLAGGVVKLILTGHKQARTPGRVDVAFGVDWIGLRGRF